MSEVRLHPIPAAGFVLFATGLVLGVPLNIAGSLLAGEIILAIFAVTGLIANLTNPAFLDRRFIAFAGLFTISLLAYVATDFFLQTELRDAIRGWARFVFLLADFIGMWVIGRKSRFNLFPLFFGYMAGQMIAWARPQPTFSLYIDLWKHHLCLPVVIGAACLIGLICHRSAAFWTIALFAAAGAGSFLIDTRAFGVICFLTAAVVSVRSVVARKTRALMPAVLLMALVACGWGVKTMLDETHEQFGRRQLGSNEMRYAAMMTAWETISLHPLQGIGSWKTDSETADRHRANVIDAGGEYDAETSNQSGHSQLLQTWLEGGPLAVLAFVYLFWRMIASLFWTLSRPADAFLGFAVFSLLNGVWSCLFSPFLGADVRINAAVSIYVCISLARERRNLALASA